MSEAKNPLTEKLRPHVADISKAAAEGDADARNIIRLYQMHVECPQDPGAPALCEAAFSEWIKKRNE